MSHEESPARSRVIAIGNPDRADDAVGPLVASKIEAAGAKEVICSQAHAVDLIDEWDHAEHVILIDAAAGGSRPGYIHRYDLHLRGVPHDLTLASTHAIGLSEIVELARTLGRLPPRIILYAIEGACFEPGAPMTAEVSASADRAARAIIAELEIRAAARPCRL